jgi:hypothetical protein
MPVVNGLILDGYRTLAEICAPLAAELARCFWVFDCQSGTFRSSYESEERNQALAERLWWDVPALANSSSCGLRPGSLPQFADQLMFDEWTYYFAIDAPEQLALTRATALAPHIGDFSEPFLRTLDGLADLFICHADGWWEFYCGRPDWSRRLASAWPGCFERGLGKAGEPPLSGDPLKSATR